MTLVSIANINNLDSATADLFNSRYAAIVSVVNGNIDSTNIKDNSIPYGKLNLANGDIPTAKLVGLTPATGTNAASGGGSTNYIQFGTLLIQWGTSAQNNYTANTGTTYLYTFPVPFATLPTVNAIARENTSVANITLYQNVAPTVNTLTITGSNPTGTLATAKVDWIAIGKSA